MSTNHIVNSIIDKYFSNADTEEVLVNGDTSLVILGRGKSVVSSPFNCNTRLQHDLQDFALSQNKRLDPYHPSTGGMLGDYRWHTVIEPVASHGPILSVRRHRFERLSLANFGIKDSQLAGIENAIDSNTHIVVCGPTGSGKTSFLSTLLHKYYFYTRVFILEELPEIPKISKEWVHLSTQPVSIEGRSAINMEDLLRESLRMRPEKVVVGEIREKEANTFAMLLDCAQGSSLTSMHSYDYKSTLKRLEKLNVDVANYPLAIISLEDKKIKSVEVS